MEKVKIDSQQLFFLVFLFELGTAIVVGLGMQAKQAAWLAILIGMFSGMILFFLIHGSLLSHYPAVPLTGIIRRVAGNFIGMPLSFAYVCYFIYGSTRLLRDTGNILTNYLLPGTPIFVIQLVIIVLIVYGCYLGIEVLARATGILFIAMVVFGVVGNITIFASNVIQFDRLMPILEEGWKPVLKTAFPLTLTFPFGEVIAFLMVLPYLNRPKEGVRTVLFAMLTSGLYLAWTSIVVISILGAYLASVSQLPLMEVARKINVGNFIQRFDPIVIAILTIGIFVKLSIFFYAAVTALTDVLRMPNHHINILPIGLVVFIYSMTIATSSTEHLEEGLEIAPLFVHLPFQYGIPLLLVMVLWIKNRLHDNSLK